MLHLPALEVEPAPQVRVVRPLVHFPARLEPAALALPDPRADRAGDGRGDLALEVRQLAEPPGPAPVQEQSAVGGTDQSHARPHAVAGPPDGAFDQGVNP